MTRHINKVIIITIIIIIIIITFKYEAFQGVSGNMVINSLGTWEQKENKVGNKETKNTLENREHPNCTGNNKGT